MNSSRLLVACAVAAGLASPVAAEDKKPAPVAVILTPGQLQVSRFLPPPPVEGSPADKAEIAELHGVEAARSPEAVAHAKSDDKTKNASIFAEAMGPGFDLKALPATAKLMDEVRLEEKIAADTAKDYFKRKRPWIADPSFQSCGREDDPLSSYPSGHTTMGFAMAVVLADIAPEKSQALLARASDYGVSRMVCGMHFRADIVAGQTLGTVVAMDLLANPAFRADRDLAAAELRKAHLAQ